MEYHAFGWRVAGRSFCSSSLSLRGFPLLIVVVACPRRTTCIFGSETVRSRRHSLTQRYACPSTHDKRDQLDNISNDDKDVDVKRGFETRKVRPARASTSVHPARIFCRIRSAGDGLGGELITQSRPWMPGARANFKVYSSRAHMIELQRKAKRGQERSETCRFVDPFPGKSALVGDPFAEASVTRPRNFGLFLLPSDADSSSRASFFAR